MLRWQVPILVCATSVVPSQTLPLNCTSIVLFICIAPSMNCTLANSCSGAKLCGLKKDEEGAWGGGLLVWNSPIRSWLQEIVRKWREDDDESMRKIWQVGISWYNIRILLRITCFPPFLWVTLEWWLVKENGETRVNYGRHCHQIQLWSSIAYIIYICYNQSVM